MSSAQGDSEDGKEPASAEERHRELVEWVPAIIYEAGFGPSAEWYYVSPYAETMLGFTAEEMTTVHDLFYDRLHPDDREDVMELERTEVALAHREDVTLVSEYRMLHRDGHVVWVRDEARIVHPEGGEPRWRGVLIDITEARAAQQALAESYERYRGLVNSLPVCAYRADPASESRRHFLSPQLRDLLGWTPEEWATDPARWAKALHPDDRERVLDAEERQATLAVGSPWVSEYRLRSKAGDVVWVRDRAVVAEVADGRHVLDGILTDITAMHGTGEALDPLRDVLRLTCSECGAVRAAEHAGPCAECGSGAVVAESLNGALRELQAVRRQVETLLDGVHRHLETVSNKEGLPGRALPASAVERRWGRRPV